MAFQPPTRPHSANPHIILNSSIFPRPSSAASTNIPSPTRLHSKNRRSHEWEDAWDSGSDQEDDVTAPIPINKNGHRKQESTGSVVAASWASGSYQHVSHRPALTSSKTYTEGAMPPPPGTGSPHATGQGESMESRLPPGGAWELVDPVVEDEAPPVRSGKEAIREDVEAILRGMWRVGSRADGQILCNYYRLCISRPHHQHQRPQTRLRSFHSLAPRYHRRQALPVCRSLSRLDLQHQSLWAGKRGSTGSAVYGQRGGGKSLPKCSGEGKKMG